MDIKEQVNVHGIIPRMLRRAEQASSVVAVQTPFGFRLRPEHEVKRRTERQPNRRSRP